MYPLAGTCASVATRSRQITLIDHHADPEIVIAGNARDNATERQGSDDVPRDNEPERARVRGRPSPTPGVAGGQVR
jgi:hypothetical protein